MLYRLRSSRRDDGFALVAVVWVLGLITLIGTTVLIGARYRSRTEAGYLVSSRADAAAESGINLAISILLTRSGAGDRLFPIRCIMPGGEQLAVTVSYESGKVDLNSASTSILKRLFIALAQDQAIGDRIANNVFAARSGTGDQPLSTPDLPAARGFQSIFELDRVPGVTPDLLRAAIPFITVRSGKVEPDPSTAAPFLREMLGLQANSTAQSQNSDDVTIQADVVVGKNGRFVREALVSPRAENGRPFVIREWRRSDAGASKRLTFRASSACLAPQ